MSILTGYRPIPPFPAGAVLDVTGLYHRLHDGVAMLEALTRRGRDVTCAHAYPNEAVDDNPHDYGQWSVIYRVAAPYLTYKGRKTSADTACTMNVRVKANGVEVATFTPVLNTDETYTWNLGAVDGLTLSDGQVTLIDLELYDEATPPYQPSGQPRPSLPDSASWGKLELQSLSMGDLVDFTEIPAWPGVPTFTTSLDAAKLEQLRACLNHVAYRVAVVPRPLFTSIAHATGLFFLDDSNNPIDYQLWRGCVERATMDRLKVEGRYRITNNAAETIRLFANGSQVATTGTLAAGAAGAFTFDVDVSAYGASTPLRLELRQRITEAAADGARPSRYSLYRVHTASTATPETMPGRPSPEELTTWSDLKTRLNMLAAVVQECYDRIEAAPEIYNRAHAFRRNYGYDDGEKAYYETRHVPLQHRRAGSRLVVCGVGPVRLAYGAATWELAREDEPDGPLTLKNTYEETIIEGEDLQTVVVPLDNYPGLTVDTAYILRGDVRGAWEYL